jgi:hypothetical protein
MRLWLKLFLSCLLGVGAGLPVWAFNPDNQSESITTVGIGVDPKSAEADAKRKAIEQVVGVYISARTQVENSQVVRDRLDTYSQGFIQSMQVLKPAEKQGDEYTFTARFVITREIHQALKEGFQAMGLQLQMQNNPDIAVFVQQSDTYDPVTLGDLVQGYAASNGFYYINSAEILRNVHQDNLKIIADYEQEHPQEKKVEIRFRESANGIFRENSYTLPAPIATKILLNLAKAGKTYYALFVKLRKLSGQEASLTVEIWQTATAKGEGLATRSIPLHHGEIRSSELEKILAEVMQDPQKGVLPLMYKYLEQKTQIGQNVTLVVEHYNRTCGKELRGHLKNKKSYRNKSLGGGQAEYVVWVEDLEAFKEELEELDCIADRGQEKKIDYQDNRIIIYFK